MSSRFLRKSTRRQIRDFDNFQNAYPNLRRSSDQTNLTFGNQSPFDDTRTIRFGTDGAIFPSMTPVGYTDLPSSSISLSSLTKIRASSQEYLPDLPGNSQSLPFDETRVNMPGTEDYIATSSVYRLGFKSATRNKIAIPIDISTSETKTLFKLSQYDTALDPAGPLYGSGSTGFVYYNFQEKRWEDIGLTDQYRGHMGDFTDTPLPVFPNISTLSSMTASNYYMMQFMGSPNSLVSTFGYTPFIRDYTLDQIDALGYGGIGQPTWFFDAPTAPRYHATSSQSFKIKDYIDQPFILEAVQIEIPVSATRKLGKNNSFFTWAGRTECSGRDIDTLNFFVYRQNGKNEQTSKRKLISYGAVSFYNSSGSDGEYFPESFLNLHEPLETFNYGLNIYNAFSESTINKRLNIKFTPKNSPFQGNSRSRRQYSLSGSFPTVFERTRLTTLDYLRWDGSDIDYLTNDDFPTQVTRLGSTVNLSRNKTASSKTDLNVSNLNPDTQFLYKTAVFPSSSKSYGSVFNKPGLTPYILLPTDELIFGIESSVTPAGLSTGPTSINAPGDSSYLAVTSSLHRILSGSAKITLYGSLIQNNQEKIFNSLNQNLVSPAIHELVFDPAEDSDQFLISERYLYTGSYIDNFMSSGTILKGTRFVSASLTAENTPVGGRGSFERFVSLNNSDEIYFDCLAVDGRTLDSEDSAFSYVPVSDKFTPVLGAGGNNLFQTDGNLRPNFPYRSGKIRIISTPTLSISSTNYTGKDFKTAFFYTGKNQYSNFPYDIRPFFSSSSPGSNYVAYGMLNVENQQPKNVFRPDRYGQMRDMLEQPFDGITYKLTGKVGPTTQPVQILFVSASSEVVVDPALTNSNNLSEHATSSLPYFDGLNLSRSTPFPTSSLGPFVPTSIVFQT